MEQEQSNKKAKKKTKKTKDKKKKGNKGIVLDANYEQQKESFFDLIDTDNVDNAVLKLKKVYKK